VTDLANASKRLSKSRKNLFSAPPPPAGFGEKKEKGNHGSSSTGKSQIFTAIEDIKRGGDTRQKWTKNFDAKD